MPPTPITRDDIAVQNLRFAQGLPGLEGIDPGRCLKTIDEWASQVASYTNRVAYLFDRDPTPYGHSPERFKAEALVTVLQRDLGVHYRQELIDLPDHQFFKDARNLFIPGVLSGHGGTCSSLPPVFVAVGRRLGYPMALCKTFSHFFARWDDPRGPRFNVECTSRGFISHPDEYYLTWPRKMSMEEARKWGSLRSLTPDGEAGSFVATRGMCLLENGDFAGATMSFADAADLDTEAPAHLGCLEHAAKLWNAQQEKRLMIGFPPLRGWPDVRRFSKLARKAAGDVSFLSARQQLLDNPALEQRWWGPLRRDPSLRPPRVPALIDVDFNYDGGRVFVKPHDFLPADFDPKKAIPT